MPYKTVNKYCWKIQEKQGHYEQEINYQQGAGQNYQIESGIAVVKTFGSTVPEPLQKPPGNKTVSGPQKYLCQS